MEMIDGKRRGIIARTVLEFLRIYSAAYFRDPRFGQNITDLVIGCAVAIGQADGKPMTASDIEHYTGLSRSTVIRHLDKLELAAIKKRPGIVPGQRSAHAAVRQGRISR